jgi:hypothetical protein
MACPRPLGKSCGFSTGKYRFGMFRNESTPQPIHQTLALMQTDINQNHHITTKT